MVTLEDGLDPMTTSCETRAMRGDDADARWRSPFRWARGGPTRRGHGGLAGPLAVACALHAAACQSTPAPAPPLAVAPPAAQAQAETQAEAPPVESAAVLANRQRHHAFTEKFLIVEKEQVNDFWRCLFGEEGSGFRFDSQEALKTALEAQLAADPKALLAKAGTECVADAQQAAAAVRKLTPPAEYAETLQRYEKSCTALSTGVAQWAAGATKSLDVREQEQRLLASGEKWSAASGPGPVDPMAWQYYQFLHCAVPDLDKLADAQALVDHLSRSCADEPGSGRPPGSPGSAVSPGSHGATGAPGSHGQRDPALLGRLRATCLAAAPPPPAKLPAAYKHTHTRFAAHKDRLKAAWEGCFRKLNQDLPGGDFGPLGQAWTDWLAASTRMYELIKKAFCEGGEKKFCDPAK